MKKILYLLILASFIGFNNLTAQSFSVGDTATFEYYDPGFFSGFYSSKYMCRAVTDFAYIFGQEEPYKISGTFTGNNEIIVYAAEDKTFFRYSDGVWEKFGVDGVKYTGKTYVKKLRAGKIHVYAVASDGLYIFNSTNWVKKVDRKDVIDVTASPSTVSNLTRYLPYIVTKFSLFTTNRNFMGQIIKLPSDLYIDEGFEPKFMEDTTLSEWTISGDVNVCRSILSGEEYYLLSLRDSAHAEKEFSLPGSVFKFNLVPVITNENPRGNVEFLDSSDSPVFTLGILDDSLFLNNEFIAELERYTREIIWGEVNIPENRICIYLGDSLIIDDSSFSFSGNPVVKVRVSNYGGRLYFDEIDVQPVETGIYASPVSKTEFYLSSTDGIYLYSNGSWSKIYDGNVLSVKIFNQNVYYALTQDNLIVKTFDGGATWDTLNQSPLEKILDFAVHPVDSNLIVVSGIRGIYKYSGGQWVDISGSLYEWAPPEYVDTVYAVEFKDSSTLVLGTGQGVFMSGDSLEEFVEINTGILKSFITSEQVQLLANYVDSAYVTMNSFFNGLARDVDNDPRVVVLAGDLSPKLTSGETKTIPVLGVMNPELNFIKDANHPHGNGHEMIEIDIYDESLDSANYINPNSDNWRFATYRAMAKLFFWTHDPQEKDWLIEGMGGIGEYLAKYTPGSPDTAVYQISPLYSLKKLEDKPYKVDFYVASLNRPYLFLLHMWDKYGLSAIQEIFGENVPPGIVGLERIAQITGTSEENLYKEWVLDVFCHRNMNMTPNLSINLTEKLFSPSYATRQTFLNWSFGGFKIEVARTDTLGFLRFNGIKLDGNSLFDIYYKIEGDSLMHVDEIDEHGDAIISDLNAMQSRDTTVFNFIVFFANSNLDDNASAVYTVKKDTLPPFVDFNYFQNNLVDQKINVYAFTDEQLYSEVNDTVPHLYLIHGGDTSIANFALFDTYRDTVVGAGDDTLITDTLVYLSSFTLNGTGKYYLKATLQDYAGNSSVFSDSVLAWYLQGGSKTVFTGFNGEIMLEIPDRATSTSGYAVYSIVTSPRYYDSHNPVYIFPEVRLQTPARIELPLKTHEKNTHVYVWYDHSWHDIGGSLNLISGRIVAYTTRLGPITLMEASNSPIPRKFAVNLTSPNVLSKGVLSFEVAVPKSTYLNVAIYGLDGRHVTSIYDGTVEGGKYSFSFRVDNLQDGVYFLIVKDNLMKVVKKFIKF